MGVYCSARQVDGQVHVAHQTGGELHVDRCVLLIYHLCKIYVTKVFGQMILFFLSVHDIDGMKPCCIADVDVLLS